MDKPWIETQEVASVLGIDPGCSAWTLWQWKTGEMEEGEDEGWIPDLASYVHEPLVEYVMNFEPAKGARRPGRRMAREQVGMRGKPDLVLDDAPEYGAGPGLVLVRGVSRGEWRAKWTQAKPWPWPPAEVMCEAEALFAVSGVKWGLVIPIADFGRPQAAIRIEPDRELRNGIVEAVAAFRESCVTGKAPPVDGRGRSCEGALDALAKSSPRAVREPRRLKPEEESVIRAKVEAVAKADEEIAGLRERIRGLAEESSEARKELLVMSSEGGPVRIGERVIRAREKRRGAERRHDRYVELEIDEGTEERRR